MLVRFVLSVFCFVALLWWFFVALTFQLQLCLASNHAPVIKREIASAVNSAFDSARQKAAIPGGLFEKQRASKDTGDKSENGWGHQIRSYVLQPYQQVKDSRSNIGYSNVEAILDGDITKIMEDVLIATSSN